MAGFGAVVFLPREGDSPSLMLEPILFDPAARWLSAALERSGVTEFLVVCHSDDMEPALPCFPKGTRFLPAGAEETRSAMAAFQESLKRVVTIDSPVFLDNDAARALPLDREPSTWDSIQSLAREISVRRLQERGVRFIDKDSVYIGPDVTVGEGTVILPGTILKGKTVIGKRCEIGPNAMIRDCVIGDGVTVNASQLNESTVDDGATVGPFAYVRPNCRIGKGVRVGDFVELKNSTIGDGTKISHLTYVGDTDAGAHINFGCGTVTVNYDGTKKFRTTIGDHAFIGCNTNLVAPVTVGEGAYTAAGSTITDDVPPDSLAIARDRQVVKKNWAAKRRRKN